MDGGAASNHEALASSAIRRRLSVVSKFYKYGISVEVLTHSPVDQVGRPKAGEETKSIGLSSPEVRKPLLAASKRSPAHLALMTLLVYNGLRIDEALGANVAGYSSICGGLAGSVRPPVLNSWDSARGVGVVCADFLSPDVAVVQLELAPSPARHPDPQLVEHLTEHLVVATTDRGGQGNVYPDGSWGGGRVRCWTWTG